MLAAVSSSWLLRVKLRAFAQQFRDELLTNFLPLSVHIPQALYSPRETDLYRAGWRGGWLYVRSSGGL